MYANSYHRLLADVFLNWSNIILPDFVSYGFKSRINLIPCSPLSPGYGYRNGSNLVWKSIIRGFV
ncbi:hypothetical protein PanWU01x14_354460 [Parasponia andersonii]|uniref:Uncharacterized protein n=1 Tax=Parasponia andersonii TaxID=3476 RepID=A0A2P5A9L8_PARAD|nr:hypothetical protein PanWU01x14_354460 [Parasponia andersonii]